MYTKKEDIIHWLLEHKIENFHIHQDLTVDLLENTTLFNIKEKKLPLHFNKCDKKLLIDISNLETLKGCPKKVQWFGLNLTQNPHLNNLKYIPKHIKEDLVLLGLDKFSDLKDINDVFFSYLEVFSLNELKELNTYQTPKSLNEKKFHYCLKYDSFKLNILPSLNILKEKSSLEFSLAQAEKSDKKIKI